MALLPDRHPQRDFFLLDLSDVTPKDDLASMEHPLFSLSTKPDMRHLKYENGQQWLRVIPSGVGLPTIFDKDILLFCISQLMAKKNQGEPIGKNVRFSVREFLIATNRPIGGDHYERIKNAITRLMGTTFETNIETGGVEDTRFFSFLESGSGFKRRKGSTRLDYCELVLADWLWRAIESNEVVSISPKYFLLRRPLERRIYEIARKHCGNQSRFTIGLQKLQNKTGSTSPLKKFRHTLRQIISDNDTPFYRIELTDADMVIFRPRVPKRSVSTDIQIPNWADTMARSIAVEKGWDYHILRSEWAAYARKNIAAGNPPDDLGAAFVGFCKRKDNLR